MKYGFFDDRRREYVITRPDTPYPWINYLGSESYFCLLSNTAGGYSFYRDAGKRRITRYRYNNVPLDAGGKYYYVYEKGDFWSPGWAPVKSQLDFYECRHGQGYSLITGEKDKLRIQIKYFVPLHDDCEIHYITIINKKQVEREIKLFSFLEFCLWDAFDDMTNFQRNYNTGEVEVNASTIYHKTEYRERRNHFSFFTVNRDISGFDTDRERFLGLYNGLSKPDAVREGCPRNSIASGWSPVGSHCIKLKLPPGAKEKVIFQLGYVENKEVDKWEKPGIINKEKARKLIDSFNSPDKVDSALEELNDYWNKLLSFCQISTPDRKMNRMINIWNQYQNVINYNLARSASYFESGISRGIGFRDSNQDLMGTIHMLPGRVKKRLLELAAIQFKDGSVYHQFQPLTKEGNNKIGSGFNDDPLWLIFGVVDYIKETGDYNILTEIVPFSDTGEGTLFEHLRASFHHVIENRGPHGLPLIGHADWNDCLNLNTFSRQPGESFQKLSNREDSEAESVLIAGMFITIAPDFIKLCKKLEENKLAEKVEHYFDKMKKAVNKYGRDKDWFLRAYDYHGKQVGSKQSDTSRIFIEPQGFCIMGGLGLEDGFAKRALDSVHDKLNTGHGLMLLAPSYEQYRPDRGEISSYPPGYKENGGIFCHSNPWIMIAETIIGNGNRAYEYYRKISPAHREEISDQHRLEPYVYAQMIAGRDAPDFGEAKNSWLTGTAAWNFMVATRWILGIRPEFEGLRIDPCIPGKWTEFNVVRKFRGDTYNINVKNPDNVNKGVKSVFLDGEKYGDNLIRPVGDGDSHNINIVMG